jgi:hypothetical protein
MNPTQTGPRSITRIPRLAVLAIVFWLLVVGCGLLVMLKFETAPGSVGAVPGRWPADSRLHRDPHHMQLLMFVHPRCPCTRASLRELAQVMAHGQGKVDAQVVFFVPGDGDKEWKKTDLWQMARDIPGVTVVTDENGREQQRFGIETSGHVLLYDAAGKLAFSGGITSGRGESGDNAGRSAVTELLQQGRPQQTETFVFGCPFCRH